MVRSSPNTAVLQVIIAQCNVLVSKLLCKAGGGNFRRSYFVVSRNKSVSSHSPSIALFRACSRIPRCVLKADSGHQPDFRDCLLLRDELPFPPSGALWSCASFVFKHRGRGFPCRALLGPQANSIREIRRGRQARHRRHELDGHREVGIGRASVYRILGAEPEHAIKMTNRFKKWPKGKLA